MSEQPIHLVSLKEAVASLRVEHRDRIHAVARWSMAQGRPVPMEHVALVIAGKLYLDGDEPELDRWTDDDVYGHLVSGMPNWCSLRRVLVPDGIAESLWTYLQFLDDQGLLAPGSDPLARLLEPVRSYAGLRKDGTRGAGRTPRRPAPA